MWIWQRPAAEAQIRPQAWKSPYAMGKALKKKKKKKKKKESSQYVVRKLSHMKDLGAPADRFSSVISSLVQEGLDEEKILDDFSPLLFKSSQMNLRPCKAEWL